MARSKSLTPTTERVATALRLQANQLANGARLPSVRRLMRQFGVSQLTVQQAIASLEEEGLVERQVGRGTFVSARNGAGAKAITILRSDYPSRRGDEITSAIHHKLKDDGHRPIVLTYCDLERAVEVLREAPHAEAYVLQPMLPQIPLSLLTFLRRRSRAVVVDGVLEGADVDAIDTDWRHGVELAVEHLMELGHRRIALASGEPTFMWADPAGHFRSIVRWTGLAADPDPLLSAPTRPGESAAAGMRDRLTELIRARGGLPFSAMIVNSYASATGALQSLRIAGLRVPEDVSLVVLDNPDLGEMDGPPLTMVGHTSAQIAERIVQRVEYRWEHPTAHYECVRYQPNLVVRQSTVAAGEAAGSAAPKRGVAPAAPPQASDHAGASPQAT